jgi:CheY-like chemotaxis protein
MTVIPFRAKHTPHVLCVDDDRTALQVRRMVLESAGLLVHTAVTAGEALTVVSRERIDLVLTDYYLDGSTGGELAHAMKELRPQLTVAIYSGAIELPDDSRYADAVIVKSEGASALIKKVCSLLARKQRVA